MLPGDGGSPSSGGRSGARRAPAVIARAGVALWIGLVLALSPAWAGETSARIVHVVMVWLKEPGNAEHRERIIEVTKSFDAVPGLETIRIGGPVMSERPVVDDSFDVGITMVFVSRAALDAYQADPVHQAAQRDVLRPLAARVIVYDFEDGGP